MLSSMTAFARSQSQGEWGSAVIEIKTVNHRFLETYFKLPDGFRECELTLRDVIAKHLKRGKVDFQLKFLPSSETVADIAVNETLARQIIDATKEIRRWAGSNSPFDIMEIVKWPLVLQTEKADLTKAHAAVLALTEEALLKVVEARQSEGARLKQFLEERLVSISKIVYTLRPKVPEIIEHYRQKLLKRIEDMNVAVDGDRVEQEIVMLAQRIDVAEELDRLTSHVEELQKILDKGGAMGRRLDFLMQELNREANTLGSKSVAVVSSEASVDLKVLIEQMREQVQNVE